jgi:gliding motility-associated-like protein
MKGTSITIIVLLSALSFVGQSNYDQWFFGRNIGLDLTTSPASVVPGFAGITQEASTAMADGSGSLMFYTNSDTIFDGNHQPMPNGMNLIGGGHSSYQGVISFAAPGSTDRYYVVSVGDASGYSPPPANWIPPYGGLAYHIIDMSANGGLGDVVVRDQLIEQVSDSNSEKWFEQRITAVPHCNGRDIWFIARRQEASSIPSFFAYLVSPSGISSPVVSEVGIPGKGFGAMKFSPDGSKLAITGSKIAPATGIMDPAYIEVFDFDKSTGQFTFFNNYPGNSVLNLGLSFSPNSRFLYFLGAGLSAINGTYQIDLFNSDMLTNTVQISTLSGNSMQLGSDSIIYINTLPTISIISQPDILGTTCDYQSAYIAPPSGSMWTGICNVMDAKYMSEEHVASFEENVTNPCDSLTISFANTSSPSSIDFSWDFGGLGSSSSENPSFTFSAPGDYLVELVVSNSECGPDTIRKIVHVGESLRDLEFFQDTICLGDTIYFAGNIIDAPGIYTDSSINNSGCDSIVVLEIYMDSLMAGFDYTASSYYAPVTVDLINLGDPGHTHVWTLDGAGTVSFNETYTLTDPGEYLITLESANENCSSIYSVSVTVLQNELIIPNVFTPNGDGNNDLFTFDNSGYSIEKVQIFNRWGMEMSTQNTGAMLWNGKNKNGNAVPEGVYYYTLSVKNFEGMNIKHAGYVQLIR